MRSVSVIGIGETKIGKHTDKTLRDLISEAGEKAISDAKIDRNQIDALYMGNFNAQFLCGQGHIGPLTSEVLNLGYIPTIRTEGACASGSLAFREALIAISAGVYDVAIVGGVEKMTHRSTEDVTSAIASAADVDFECNSGITFPGIFAMIANKYFAEYGNCREAMTKVAIQNHENAALNPDAQMQKEITKEKVENSMMIADPLTVFDCSLVSDGAVFVILAATNVAKEISSQKCIEIIGSGHAGDTLTAETKKSLTEFAATKLAAKQAYEMANITPKDIDLAEVHDCFTITQIINCEDLGFFEKGKAPKAILEGKTARANGEIAINPSGGLKAKGHPIGATGLSQIYEIVTQLRGEAGKRQVSNAKIGLTHNIGGTAATCVVNIFKEAL